jgi:hypothetical protein
MVGKYGVGFSGLLELFFGHRVTRISIGVIFEGELPVGTLDVLAAGVTRHP